MKETRPASFLISHADSNFNVTKFSFGFFMSNLFFVINKLNPFQYSIVVVASGGRIVPFDPV